MSLREVFLYEITHVIHISGNILYQFIYPSITLCINRFYCNLSHNASLAVTCCCICLTVCCAEFRIFNNNVGWLKSCYVKSLTWRSIQYQTIMVLFIQSHEACKFEARICKVTMDLIIHDHYIVL